VGDLVREHSLGVVVEPEDPVALRCAIESFLARDTEADAANRAAALRYAASTDHGVLGALVREVYARARAERRP
jgi:hypothetical protein